MDKLNHFSSVDIKLLNVLMFMKGKLYGSHIGIRVLETEGL